jgi:tetratricopeptide (TPR) repeat protein
MTLNSHDLDMAQASDDSVQPSEAVIDEIDITAPTPVTAAIEPPAATSSLWGKLRRRLWPSENERVEDYLRQLAVLDETVARYPQSSSGYVLRGELHLSAGLIDPALRDFRRGLALAERQLYTEQWGLVAQVMRDRAREGLTQALSLRR